MTIIDNPNIPLTRHKWPHITISAWESLCGFDPLFEKYFDDDKSYMWNGKGFIEMDEYILKNQKWFELKEYYPCFTPNKKIIQKCIGLKWLILSLKGPIGELNFIRREILEIITDKDSFLEQYTKFFLLNENGDKIDLETGAPLINSIITSNDRPWIPIEKGLPTQQGRYEATIAYFSIDGSIKQLCIEILNFWKEPMINDFRWKPHPLGRSFEHVIAWRELDKPYELSKPITFPLPELKWEKFDPTLNDWEQAHFLVRTENKSEIVHFFNEYTQASETEYIRALPPNEDRSRWLDYSLQRYLTLSRQYTHYAKVPFKQDPYRKI